MNEMTLPSRHRIRNLSTSGLMPSTLPLGQIKCSLLLYIFLKKKHGKVDTRDYHFKGQTKRFVYLYYNYIRIITCLITCIYLLNQINFIHI